MKNNIKQLKIKTDEEIAGIARDIIYKIQNEDTTMWLELKLMRLYYEGVLLGREQIIYRDKETS